MTLPLSKLDVYNDRDAILKMTYGLEPKDRFNFPFCQIANQTVRVKHGAVVLRRTKLDSASSTLAMQLYVDPYAAEVLGWVRAAKSIFMERCSECIFSSEATLPSNELKEFYGVSGDRERLCTPRLARVIPEIFELLPDFTVNEKGVLRPAVMGVVAEVINQAFPLIFNTRFLHATIPAIDFRYRPLLGLEQV